MRTGSPVMAEVCATCGGSDVTLDAWGPLPPEVARIPALAAALQCAWCHSCQAETRLVPAGAGLERPEGGG
jgi:hypothetical protein